MFGRDPGLLPIYWIEAFELERDVVLRSVDIHEKNRILYVVQECLVLPGEFLELAFPVLPSGNVPAINKNTINDIIFESIPHRRLDPAPRVVGILESDFEDLRLV